MRLVLLGLLLSLPGMLHACWVAGPGPHGEGGHAMTAQEARESAVIAAENAVIIWDDARKIEHFIRQADIVTSAPDVGFIVPTPQTPELAEADLKIFWMADDMAKPKALPKVVYRTPLEAIHNAFPRITSVYTTISTTLSYASKSGVEVLQEKDVSGYHAVTLAADDVAALSNWLKENGYASTPAAEAWLQTYVAAHWKITAFKLTKRPGEAGFLRSKAIRMSFPTDRPFFPYSEPGDTAQPDAAKPAASGRQLNVAILSPVRMAGALKDGHAWPGKLQYAGSSVPAKDSIWKAPQWLALAGLDQAKDEPVLPLWLTYFTDTSNPRPGTSDLYFSPSADASPVQQTYVDDSLPIDYRMDWSHPLSNIAAGLILLVFISPFVAFPIFVFSSVRSVRRA